MGEEEGVKEERNLGRKWEVGKRRIGRGKGERMEGRRDKGRRDRK